jgi:hypothetical protein
MPSKNVDKAIKGLKKDPQLVKELNQALTKVYAKAGVSLTQTEKVEVVRGIADSLDAYGHVTGD